jgi:hypothetical protein
MADFMERASEIISTATARMSPQQPQPVLQRSTEERDTPLKIALRIRDHAR